MAEHDHGDHAHGHHHDRDHDHRQAGWGARLVDLLHGHSHDAADSVDDALESSHEGVRALKISLVVLAVTAGLQLVVVLLSGSVALLADTIHNVADALTAVPLWVAFAVGRRPATRRYTYGYGRAEDLAGIFVVVMIALSALLAGYEAIRRLVHPEPIAHTSWVLVAGVIGFVGNELVATYRIRVGRRIGSAALVADGMHARTDGLTSLAVVAGAIGVILGFPLADPVVGLGITAAILFVLRSAARDIYRRLMDAVDPDLLDLAEQILADTDGVVRVESVRVRWIGHGLYAEASLDVNAGLDLARAHEIAHTAQDRLRAAVPKLREATMHVSPAG